MVELKRKFKCGFQQKCRVDSLRKAITCIAKIPTPVTLRNGKKVFAVIYTQKYEEAVKYLVDHYNNGTLDIYDSKSIREFGEGHNPIHLNGLDGENGNRQKAPRLMDFIKDNADVVEKPKNKEAKNGEDNNSSK